jgi:hypothetical protein
MPFLLGVAAAFLFGWLVALLSRSHVWPFERRRKRR